MDGSRAHKSVITASRPRLEQGDENKKSLFTANLRIFAFKASDVSTNSKSSSTQPVLLYHHFFPSLRTLQILPSPSKFKHLPQCTIAWQVHRNPRTCRKQTSSRHNYFRQTGDIRREVIDSIVFGCSHLGNDVLTPSTLIPTGRTGREGTVVRIGGTTPWGRHEDGVDASVRTQGAENTCGIATDAVDAG